MVGPGSGGCPESVYLGGEDEVALRKAAYLVREDRYLGPAPAEGDVRMVALLLGQLSNPVDEVQVSRKFLKRNSLRR